MTYEAQQRQLRRSRSVLRRRHRTSSARKRQRLKLSLGTRRDRQKHRILHGVPASLRFHIARKQRLIFEEFAAGVEHSLAAGYAEVVLDFKPTILLHPCGLLMLMGLVDDWLARYPGRLKARYPTDDLVEQMLQQVEVLQKLGLEARKQISHVDVTRWHYFTGTNVEGGKIEPFMDKVGELLSDEAQKGLYDCIAEAMTNVKHHAYAGGAEGRWWMFGTISDNRAFVAMHDRGASIPITLLAKPRVRDYLSARVIDSGARDGHMIAAAAGGRTSTELPYRGKGLPEMLDYTRSTSNSSLSIYSRRGCFRFVNKNRQLYESIGKLGWPVKGTLILWGISLSGD